MFKVVSAAMALVCLCSCARDLFASGEMKIVKVTITSEPKKDGPVTCRMNEKKANEATN